MRSMPLSDAEGNPTYADQTTFNTGKDPAYLFPAASGRDLYRLIPTSHVPASGVRSSEDGRREKQQASRFKATVRQGAVR